MHLRITRLLWPAALLVSSISLSGMLSAQDLSEAKAICKDLSADNRAMAKAAGYDLDGLCRSLNKRSSIGDKDSEEMAPAKSRRTVSSSRLARFRDGRVARDGRNGRNGRNGRAQTFRL
jgi:hypothetical protein